MKKVLSFVLVLALVLSSFSMAFAAQSTEIKSLSDIKGNANEEAIQVNHDLGIVTGNPDGTFQPEKAVTRAEFAAMITRALAIPDSALAAYSSTSFKDTNGYAWAVPYLAFCNSKGIMLGDGAGNAMPAKTITVNEAVTMALRAIGYTANSSELTGVWPSNYVTKAQELNLYDDVAKNATGVDKANAAQIIYNILTVQKVAVNSDGETKKLWDKEPNTKNSVDGVPTTLLTAGLNCKAEAEQVVGIASIDDSLIEIAKYIGQYGTIYRNAKNDKVVAFIADSDTLVGRFTDNDKFVTTDEEKEYTIKDKTKIDYVLKNGDKVATNKAIADLSKGMGSTEYAINVDLSGKTIKELYSAVEWTVTSADKVDAAQLSDIKDDKELLGSKFAKDDNDGIDYTQFQLVGADSLANIKADSVVYVYANNKKEIVKIEVGTEVVTGVVKNFKKAKSDAATKFAIGANTYKNAADVINGNLASASSVSEDEVSNEVKAFIDARGYVYDFEDTTSADNFAVVEKASKGIDDQVKLMLADGTEKVFTYDDDAKKAGNIAITNGLIGYGLNKNGVITDSNRHFAIAQDVKLGNTKSITSMNGVAAVNGSAFNAGAAAPTNAKIASDVKVFTYDKVTTAVLTGANWSTTDIGDIEVTTIDKVEIGKAIKNAVLLFAEKKDGTTDTNKVVAMLLPSDMAKSGTKSFAVVNELTKTANDKGDKVWQTVGYIDGKKLDALTDDAATGFYPDWATPNYTNVATFLLYEVKVAADGTITDAKKVVTGGDYKVVGITSALTVKTPDKRASFVGSDNVRYAIADNAVFYEVDGDEFKLSSSALKENDKVVIYEVNDDADGYDVVFFSR